MRFPVAGLDRGRADEDVGSVEDEWSPLGCPVAAVLRVDAGEAPSADADAHQARIPINRGALTYPSGAPPHLIAEADD